ncbi:GIN domain-containing protein [Sphingosinicella sp. CPCC 101087]|uniref:GIN domain-containing protein n=1 Tax=Sphingosinicella sp. CPCC 101087 TaxID=2497754 RepID=UPI0019815485|nr:DUF2807 domain-containing protein [Sphingosinicella sp. CPCC 101087]
MRFAVTAALGAAAIPAAAQTPVPVPQFDSMELRGGGTVTLRHGMRQRVTLLSGDLETSRFTVDDEGQLTIQACRNSCRDYRLQVEIVTPDVGALAIHGGGSIRTAGAFPRRANLAVAITGGGTMDVDEIESANVAASIRGGGTIVTHARANLSTSIVGGGSVRYRGDPQISTAISGGGTVSPVG